MNARDIAERYGAQLWEHSKGKGLSRPRVRALLADWMGEPVSTARARKVWDLVRAGIGRNAGRRQSVEDTQAGPLDRTLSAQGVHVRTLDQLLDYCEVDRKVWRVARHRVNTWQQAQKDKKTGGSRVVQLFQVRADLERRLVPVAKPARVSIKAPKPKRRADGLRRVVFLPDPQIGCAWSIPRYDKLRTLHDARALDLAVQVCQRWQPDNILCLGDLMDAAGFGKYDTSASLRQTTQPALAIAHYWLSCLRAVCPTAEMHIMEGNHDVRYRKAVERQLAEAEGVTASGDTLPALDIRRLLGLDALGIAWEGSPYDRSFYLWDRIRVQHGSVVRAKGGQTVASIASGATIDTVCGHIHRREQAARVVYGPKGPRVVQVMSPGCLTKTDGSTPGRSMEPDWHQAIGFGVWDPASDMVSLHSVPIMNGRMLWDGEVLLGEERSAQVAEATGWHQLAKGGEDGKA